MGVGSADCGLRIVDCGLRIADWGLGIGLLLLEVFVICNLPFDAYTPLRVYNIPR
jgi:hypothetical protein